MVSQKCLIANFSSLPNVIHTLFRFSITARGMSVGQGNRLPFARTKTVTVLIPTYSLVYFLAHNLPLYIPHLSRWSRGMRQDSWRGGFLLAALELYLKSDMKAKFHFLKWVFGYELFWWDIRIYVNNFPLLTKPMLFPPYAQWSWGCRWIHFYYDDTRCVLLDLIDVFFPRSLT